MQQSQSVAATLGASLLTALLAGCGGGDGTAEVRETTVPATEASADRAAGQVPLAIAGWDETQAMIADQRGKVVVLDLWTTW